MKQISGSILNYFLVYHLLANLMIHIVFYFIFVGEEGAYELSTIYFILLGSLNLLGMICIYSPYYMKKCKTIYSDGNILLIGKEKYIVDDIILITKNKYSYGLSAYSYYTMKIRKNTLDTTKQFDYVNFANKAQLRHISSLIFFWKDLDNTIEFLRAMGFRKKVTDGYI